MKPWSGKSSALWGCLLAVGLLAGCSVFTKPESPSELPPPKPPEHPPSGVSEQRLGQVAILYADNVPVYRTIANELMTKIPVRAKAVLLHNEAQANAWVRDEDEISKYDQIVAIGVLAARSASELTDKQVVFCQVFNFHDYGLTSSNVRGVSILPPPDQQFRAWKKLAPDVERVGVITGPGHEKLIEQARTAARRQGMELIHHVAQTDKETLYVFKRLTPDINGLWLLPDDRILSHRVLRELMDYSVRHEKPVLVFHPELLQLGGLMSASGVESDIADQVLAVLQAHTRDSSSAGFSLSPLTKARIEINTRLARQLGYSVKPLLKSNANVQ